MKWINPKEELPIHGQRVLFAYSGTIMLAVFCEKYINEHINTENVFRSTNGGHYDIKQNLVDGWMPLPQPPKQ